MGYTDLQEYQEISSLFEKLKQNGDKKHFIVENQKYEYYDNLFTLGNHDIHIFTEIFF